MLTVTLDIVVNELSLIAVAISPGELSDPLLHSLAVVALELGSVGPALHTWTVLRIMFPEAAIQRAILMEVEAEAMSLVVLPLSLVDVAVLMQQSAIVVGLVLVPVALIEAAIGPDLHTASLAHRLVTEPLTNVA